MGLEVWMSGQVLFWFTAGVWDIADTWQGTGSSFASHVSCLCCSRPWSNEMLVASVLFLFDEKSRLKVLYGIKGKLVSSLRALGASACGYWCLRNWLKCSPSCECLKAAVVPWLIYELYIWV